MLNDLGGSVSGATLGAFGSGRVRAVALIALNFNGSIDATIHSMVKRDKKVAGHSSAFSFKKSK